MLLLPDVDELVGDELGPRPLEGLAQQDGRPDRVAVEAAEPGQAEDERRDDDAHALKLERPRVERPPLDVAPGTLGRRPLFGTPSESDQAARLLMTADHQPQPVLFPQ